MIRLARRARRRAEAPRRVRPPSAAVCARGAVWSQELLAAKAGLSGKFLGEVERGEKSISLDNLAHLARALRVPLMAMLKGLEAREGMMIWRSLASYADGEWFHSETNFSMPPDMIAAISA